KSRLAYTVKQSLIAFLPGLGELIAGWMISRTVPMLDIKPWILIAYPMLLTSRGNVAGILSGNLSTLLNIGIVKPSLRKNTHVFYALISGTIFLTIITGLVGGLLTLLSFFMFYPLSILDFYEILGVYLSTAIFSSFLTIPVTALVGISSFRFGLDPDIVVYPIMSTLTDIVISISYFFMINLIIGLLNVIEGLLMLSIFLLLSFLFVFRFFKSDVFIRLVKESCLIVVILILVASLSGNILSTLRSEIIKNPAILIVFPALTCTAGDIGSVIGSMMTTKLVIGFLKPGFNIVIKMLPEILGTEIVGAMLFMIYGLIGSVTEYMGVIETLRNILVTLSSNIICFPIILLISLVTAILTFRRGWNPDNFVIPIEATLADLITTISLVLACMILL
ncbi:MAG: hypothetical protein DRJ31_09010, partial [Candidatus Methanomethylicota archaeon]